MRNDNGQFEEHRYISIAGVMGSGKTTVANLLAKELGLTLFEENADENTFLPLFYKDPARWALHAQLFYLRERAGQLAKIKNMLDRTGIVQDSPIHQDYLTYAKAQHILGHMNEAEFSLYEKFFHALHGHLPAPHLIIQLEASPKTLAERIKRRARDYEKEVDIAYLTLLSELQKKWIAESEHLHIMVVPTDAMNLAASAADRAEFVETVKSRLVPVSVAA